MNKNENDKKTDSFAQDFFSFVKDIAISLCIVFLVIHFLVRPVQVKGNSMYPTLKNGDFAFSNVLGMKTGKIRRFDIVIIHIPEKNEYIVKRVIGLPGETVEYSSGQLYINGEPVDEPFLDQDYVSQYGNTFMSDVSPVTLGEEEYYCLGDNRPNSSDSRVYGPFSKDRIASKGLCILFPFSDFGLKTW